MAEMTPRMVRVAAARGIKDLREELRRRYHDEGETVGSLARDFDVDQSTVFNWLRRLGIPTRPVARTRTDERQGA